jgi:hypothetical protein
MFFIRAAKISILYPLAPVGGKMKGGKAEWAERAEESINFLLPHWLFVIRYSLALA